MVLSQKGKLIEYSVQRGEGLIQGEQGHYTFLAAEWVSAVVPQPGMRLTFEADGQTARQVTATMATDNLKQAGHSVQASLAAQQDTARRVGSVLWRIARTLLIGTAVVLVALVVVGEFIDPDTPAQPQEAPLSADHARALSEGLRQGFAVDPNFNFPEYCQSETATNREYTDCIALAQAAAAQSGGTESSQ